MPRKAIRDREYKRFFGQPAIRGIKNALILDSTALLDPTILYGSGVDAAMSKFHLSSNLVRRIEAIDLVPVQAVSPIRF